LLLGFGALDCGAWKLISSPAPFTPWMGVQNEYELREARSAIKDQLEQMMLIAV
jgi:hypothetical protein